MTLTPEQLNEIKRRAMAASPGPWFPCDFRGASSNSPVHEISVSCDWPAYIGIASMERGLTAAVEEALANAAFIAAARTDVPSLIAALRAKDEELRAEKERVRELEEGLKPFAYFADFETALKERWPEMKDQSDSSTAFCWVGGFGLDGPTMSLGDLRRAAALLKLGD